jgi:hypothetical protein
LTRVMTKAPEDTSRTLKKLMEKLVSDCLSISSWGRFYKTVSDQNLLIHKTSFGQIKVCNYYPIWI